MELLILKSGTVITAKNSKANIEYMPLNTQNGEKGHYVCIWCTIKTVSGDVYGTDKVKVPKDVVELAI